MFAPLTPKELLGRKLGPLVGGRVLDVATGRGDFVRMLAEFLGGYDEFVGIDIKQKAIDDARKAFEEQPGEVRNTGFRVMDAAALEYVGGSFDTVAISNSLHHMADVDRVLGEMKRVLRAGGLLVVREMFRDNQTETQMTHVLLHAWWAKINQRQGETHNETFTRQELVAVVDKLGLGDTDMFDFADTASDPKDPELIESVIDRNLKLVEGINSHPDYAKLKAEGERLNQRLQNVGFHSATQLMMLGRKR